MATTPHEVSSRRDEMFIARDWLKILSPLGSGDGHFQTRPNTRLLGAAKQQPCDQRRFPVAPACQARAQGATKTHRVVAGAQASFPPRNKNGFASSSEVSDQNNVAGLRTTSKHKIGSICGKSKSKDEIRFEVG